MQREKRPSFGGFSQATAGRVHRAALDHHWIEAVCTQQCRYKVQLPTPKCHPDEEHRKKPKFPPLSWLTQLSGRLTFCDESGEDDSCRMTGCDGHTDRNRRHSRSMSSRTPHHTVVGGAQQQTNASPSCSPVWQARESEQEPSSFTDRPAAAAAARQCGSACGPLGRRFA